MFGNIDYTFGHLEGFSPDVMERACLYRERSLFMGTWKCALARESAAWVAAM